jgi:hypothetical protein
MPDLTPHHLLSRLDAIGRSLARRPQARALIGLGSVGQETTRLDRWSDLDFFVIVDEGAQGRFLEDLGWLEEAAALTWHYRNTHDGHKAWMVDGVFCEFAVFAPSQLEAIPHAPGRTVWARCADDEAWASPRRPLPRPDASDPTWLLGELLGNLHVGLLRWRRGERLAGSRLVQVHALDRLIGLATSRMPPAGPIPPDPFNAERRLEWRFPDLGAALTDLMPGIDQTPAAALAMLDWLETHGHVLPPAIAAGIRALAQDGRPPPDETTSP